MSPVSSKSSKLCQFFVCQGDAKSQFWNFFEILKSCSNFEISGYIATWGQKWLLPWFLRGGLTESDMVKMVAITPFKQEYLASWKDPVEISDFPVIDFPIAISQVAWFLSWNIILPEQGENVNLVTTFVFYLSFRCCIKRVR